MLHNYNNIHGCKRRRIIYFLSYIGAKLANADNYTAKWFEVDFLKWTKVTGLKTQGHADNNEFIEQFNIHYSTDGINFGIFKEHGNIKV